MKVSIPYGEKRLQLDFPHDTRTLSITEPQPTITFKDFSKKIDNALKRKKLNLNRTIIVVADKTRVCGYPEYLPVLVDTLLKNGQDKSTLNFLIAYGTHPRQTDEECLQCYGEIYSHIPFIHHDCSNPDNFTEIALTTSNTPVRIRKDIIDATCVITIGPICHHYFAGYGGGRKLIFPGCGEKEAIYQNHGLYLNRKSGSLSVNCQPGVLEDNPLAEDLFEIESYSPADLSIHGIMDSHGQLCDFLVGSGREVFLEACRTHGQYCEINSERFSTVIASCGGFPKDINFIQGHKAIHNSSMFVEDNGTLIMYSECRDGIGSNTFLPWFDKKDFHKAFKVLSASYQGNGGTALAMMEKTMRIRIVLVSSFDVDLCSTIGVEKWSHDQVQEYLKTINGNIGYIPNGSLLVKKSDS